MTPGSSFSLRMAQARHGAGPRVGVLLDSLSFTRSAARGVMRYVRSVSSKEAFRIAWYARDSKKAYSREAYDGLIGMISSYWPPAELRDAGIPIINLSSVRPTKLSSVLVDDMAVGRMACEHLVSRGLRQLGFIGMPGVYYAELRWQGFAQAAGGHGLVPSRFMFSSDRPVSKMTPDTIRKLARWLQKQPRPLGLLLANYSLASVFYEVCSQLNLSIPDQVAVICAGEDTMLSDVYEPSLTAVHVDAEHIGFEAGRLMSQLLRDKSSEPRTVLVPPRGVVLRQSTEIFVYPDVCVAAAMSMILQNAHRQISVEDVRKHVGCSRRTLEYRFRQHTGRTPLEEIQRARIEYVKQCLFETDRSVTQIAQDCGFRYVRQLNAAFRQWTGMTPGRYREMMHHRLQAPEWFKPSSNR